MPPSVSTFQTPGLCIIGILPKQPIWNAKLNTTEEVDLITSLEKSDLLFASYTRITTLAINIAAVLNDVSHFDDVFAAAFRHVQAMIFWIITYV